MKIRIRFRKYGVMKFIGHLDIMRYFQKAMRRADIDIAYSEGFSPHQIMSFAAPLGVGIISDGEYLDIEVHSTRPSRESIDALNAVMVEGVEVTDYVLLPDKAKKSMAIVAAAEYDVWYKISAGDLSCQKDSCKNSSASGPNEPAESTPSSERLTPEEITAGIHDYYDCQDEITITKQTKKSERVVDVRPHIFEFSLFTGEDESGAETYGFHLFLSAGSEENIKPELVIEDFCRFLGKPWNPYDFQIRRNDVYARTEKGFVPLNAFGEVISE